MSDLGVGLASNLGQSWVPGSFVEAPGADNELGFSGLWDVGTPKTRVPKRGSSR